jgi:hypothetical protein
MVRVDARELPSSGDWERLVAELKVKELVVERQADRIAWLVGENARLCRLVAETGSDGSVRSQSAHGSARGG